jgi:hypothetical protein
VRARLSWACPTFIPETSVIAPFGGCVILDFGFWIGEPPGFWILGFWIILNRGCLSLWTFKPRGLWDPGSRNPKPESKIDLMAR